MIKIILLTLLLSSWVNADQPTLVVGSKPFTEGYILTHLAAEIAKDTGETKVIAKTDFAGEAMVLEALKANGIQLYADYTGTITRTILKDPTIKGVLPIRKALEPLGLTITDSLGFNNTYALAIRKDMQERLNLKNISDLPKHPELRIAVSHAFLNRDDGIHALEKHYGFRFRAPRGIEHNLSYQALASKKADVIDIYSTDAKISEYDIALLKDDRKFFPTYKAVFVTSTSFPKKFPKTWAALNDLKGKISESDMVALNARAEIDKIPARTVAAEFLRSKGWVKSDETLLQKRSYPLWRLTKEHLFLVCVSVALAIFFGIPLGVLAWQFERFGHVVLGVTGILQTIPSLALLCFLIPLFGIGTLPSLIALFLYGLLPIVRSTQSGLAAIEPHYIESARTLGLRGGKLLTQILLPMASMSILSGIKTSTIINVGTATLAAFIGAGGYGTQIVTGLALNDTQLILQGAVPAAIMALILQALFELVDRLLVSPGLRLTA